jgi:hypothetical protein
LKSLVNDKRTTEVTVANEFKHREKDGSIKTTKIGAFYSNDLEDAKKLMPGATPSQLKELGIKDETKAHGLMGYTLFPGGEKDTKGDGKGSTNGNVQVYISSDLNERDAARTEAHETNGHALFFVQGKEANHGEDRESDNPTLEKQIYDVVTETEKNYDGNKKKKQN